jgi:hypothetical protein
MSDLSPLSRAKRKLDFGDRQVSFDPTATLASHCGNASDFGFQPSKVPACADTMWRRATW